MELIANGRLSYLYEQRVRVMKQLTVQNVAALEFLSQYIPPDGVSPAGNLNDCAERGCIRQDGCYTDDTFISNKTHFQCFTVCRAGDIRDYRFVGKIDIR